MSIDGRVERALGRAEGPTSGDGFPPAPEHTPLPQYPLESADNALRLLFLIGERRTLRLTDASQYLQVASSTAYRLLAMLVYRGFIKQDPVSRVYGAGPALERIATAVHGRQDLRVHVRPILERLNLEVQETVHLGRLEGREVHFLDSIESPRAVRVGSRAGRFMAAHCTSTGKAMLAQLDEEQLRLLYPDKELQRLTSKSIGSYDELVCALDKVRGDGHATSVEESEDGVTSVAVTIKVAPPILAAINVSMPTGRSSTRERKRALQALRSSATVIERSW